MKLSEYLQNKKRSLDDKYMRVALEAAEIAKSNGDAARGAVIVFPNAHVVSGNTILTDHDPIAYAEMNALRKACNMTNKSFRDAVMYCTTEPNSFCATAAYEHGIQEIVFGAYDDVNGFISSPRGIKHENFNLYFLGGILAEQCFQMATPTFRESLRY